ncbi:MAG: site-specific integrase [Bacteroidia bacterium]|nr:site-specific integrase [Bacteroidia bacterium]
MKTEGYTHYLQSEKLGENSIREHLINMERFCKWAAQQQFKEIDHITYTELLEYVKHEKEKGLKVQTIKLRLNSLHKYYEYLKHIGLIEKNPTKKIKLKGELKTITQNVLSYTELEQLYNDYHSQEIKASRNKLSPYTKQKNVVLLGLMIWQGAVSGEIEKLTVEHVNLNQGTIYIPRQGRGASRELKLFPNQVLQLYKYIHEARPKLISPSGGVGVGLIPGNINNHLFDLMQELKGLNQKIHNASQLRTSIIIHWLKVHGKRQAQYMAGHKYISSTERFELQEIDSLTDTLLKHHPFS